MYSNECRKVVNLQLKPSLFIDPYYLLAPSTLSVSKQNDQECKSKFKMKSIMFVHNLRKYAMRGAL